MATALTPADAGMLCALATELFPRSAPRIRQGHYLELTDPVSLDRVTIRSRQAWDTFRRTNERLGPAERMLARGRLIDHTMARLGASRHS